MGDIERLSSGAPWEPIAGYSRAVRSGEWFSVAGTTATDERGTLVGVGQMYVQARQAIQNIQKVLERGGLSLSDVVRTRMFVTDIARFAEVAKAHREFFGEAPPASTMVEVRRLVHPDMLIEIEADAYSPTANAREPKLAEFGTPRPKKKAPVPKKPAAKKRTASRKRPRR